MSNSLTSRLKLIKPDPGSSEPVDVSKLNQNFDKIDAAVAAAEVTSTTRPSTPFPNQLIRETNTRRMYIWNATQSTWDQISTGAGQDINFENRLQVTRGSGSDNAFQSRVSGDVNDRVAINADGSLDWGSGSAAPDASLSRTAASRLQVSGALVVTGGFSTTSSVMRPTEAKDNTNQTGLSNSSPAAGSPVVGFTFVAPPSGIIMITTTGYIYVANASSQVILSWELRTGGTVGSGTLTPGAADANNGLRVGRAAASELSGSCRTQVSGLTAGNTYNIRTMHWMGTGTGGAVPFRYLMVEPIA